MARKIDPAIETIIKGFGLDPKAVLWDCHGTWCMYHRAIEQVAADIGIRFDPPQVIEANGAAKSVAICVTGHQGDDRSEWSIGEASPGNCKNAYFYAMAEKRAKDRVVLKLIGLHGLVYSEDEMNEEEPKAEPASKITTLQRLLDGIKAATENGSLAELEAWYKTNAADIAGLQTNDKSTLRKAYQFAMDVLKAGKEAA